MKGLKKNVTHNKGGKNASVNSKLAEDMVPFNLFSKTKSRMLLLSTTPQIQVSSIDKTSEVFLAILHILK